MRLREVLEQLDEIKKSHPGGFSFKTKSKFLGVSGPSDEKILSMEELESDEWGFVFESHDEEFNRILGDTP